MNKEQQKQFYDVKIEALVPTTLTYRVFALDENDALKQIQKQAPNNYKPNFLLKRMLKAIVYIAGSSNIKLTKYFR